MHSGAFMGQIRTKIGHGALMGWTNLVGKTIHSVRGHSKTRIFVLQFHRYPNTGLAHAVE